MDRAGLLLRGADLAVGRRPVIGRLFRHSGGAVFRGVWVTFQWDAEEREFLIDGGEYIGLLRAFYHGFVQELFQTQSDLSLPIIDHFVFSL